MQKSVFEVAQEEHPNCVGHKEMLDLPPPTPSTDTYSWLQIFELSGLL